MAKELWKGNEAIAEAAIRAGCRHYFGYPITPQSEIPEYMARRMPEVGGVFVQSESEVAAINMVYGAAGAGARAMTTSSSPGISLMQEGMSYLAGAELPCVIVNVMRGGPGLGTILAAQGDYFQATRGGGHGDYRNIVLAPVNIQEAVQMTQEAFDLADLYRIPVMILLDGMIGQMMEAIEWPELEKRELPSKEWATTGNEGRTNRRIINSLYIDAPSCARHNERLAKKHAQIESREVRYVGRGVEGAEVVFVAYGTPARIAQAATERLAQQGVRAGVFRPQTLWPFPYAALQATLWQESVKAVVCFELSHGQMLDDVKIALEGRKCLEFVGSSGGEVLEFTALVDCALSALARV
ncbi:MAG: 3-methyl-2-oxobutanoate dehydrogenase subunit VorB [Bradymonadales bacterium]|jgi:2-oxoglutarate ferredoxin oxidoreductase subunit alpha